MNPYVLLTGGTILLVVGIVKKIRGNSFDGDAGRFTINGLVLIILGLAWYF